MAKAARRATSLTTLVIGKVEVPVGLFATVNKPGGLAQFATAGPNGGVLKAQATARATPVDEVVDVPDVPVHSDPLAGDFDDLPVAIDSEHPLGQRAIAEAERERVDGQYGRELVEEGSGVVVLPQDVRRGVRLEDGRFIDCTEQLGRIDEATKLERMEVISFVDISQIPRARMKGVYYLGAADEKAPRALRIIFEGLKFTRRAAVVKLTKKTRQTLGAIGWLGDSLMLYELVWAEDYREPPARATRIQQAEVSQAEVSQFCKLVHAMSASVESLDALRDDAIELREELMAKALAGEVPEVLEPVAKPDEAAGLLAELEASLAAVGS